MNFLHKLEGKYLDYINYAALLTGMVLFVFLRILSSGPRIATWMATQWSVTYQDGIISRGLAGTVAWAVLGEPTILKIALITIAFYLVLILFVFILMIFYLKKQENRVSVYLLIVFCLANPLTLAFFTTFEMFGRYDLILTLLALVSVWLIRSYYNKPWFYLVPMLSVVGIFIHQGYLVLYCAFILFFYIHQCLANDQKPKILKTLTLSLPPFLSYFYLALSKLPYNSVAQMTETLQSRVNYEVFHITLQKEYFWTLKDHFDYSTDRLFHSNIYIDLIFVFLLLIPTLLVFYFFWRDYLEELRPNKSKLIASVLLLFSTLAPFALFFIGVDYFRWISAFVILNFVALFFITYDREELTKKMFSTISKFTAVLLSTILIYAMMGPTKEARSYDRVHVIIDNFVTLINKF